MIEYVMGLAFITLFFLWNAHISKSPIIVFGALGIALVEVIIIAGSLYGMAASIDLSRLYQVNFYGLMSIGLGVAFFSLYGYALNLINPEEDNSEDVGKWEGYGKW